MVRINIKDLDPEELERFVISYGQEPYRARQIGTWIYRKSAASFEQMSNLPKELRSFLEDSFSLVSSLNLSDKKTSLDGTIKYLFELDDGERLESVFIPEDKRYTLCVSTQVGCAMACTFCLTGRIGRIRNLRPSEILDQFIQVNDDNGGCITNLVFMGMGEPLDNLKNTISSLKTFIHKDYLGLSPKKITVSTSGLVPQIKELGKQVPVNLSISLNAPNDLIRNEIMPINRRYSIKELINAGSEYPFPKRKLLTFEYVLLKDKNDSDEDARSLGELLKGVRCKVNLIPFNEAKPLVYKSPDEDRVFGFQRILISYGINVRIRKNRGRDILGACGQLAADYPTKKLRKRPFDDNLNPGKEAYEGF